MSQPTWFKRLKSFKFLSQKSNSKIDSKNDKNYLKLSFSSESTTRTKGCSCCKSSNNNNSALTALREAQVYNQDSYCYLPSRTNRSKDRVPPRSVLNGSDRKGPVIRYYSVPNEDSEDNFNDNNPELLRSEVKGTLKGKSVQVEGTQTTHVVFIDKSETDNLNYNDAATKDKDAGAEIENDECAHIGVQDSQSEISLRTRILNEYENSFKERQRKHQRRRKREYRRSLEKRRSRKRSKNKRSLQRKMSSSSTSDDDGGDLKIPTPKVLKRNLKYYGKDEDKVNLFKTRTKMLRLKRSMMIAVASNDPTPRAPSIKNILKNGAAPIQYLHAKFSNKFRTWHRNQWPY